MSGRVRLRKRVVTETVTQTVKVRREELVIDRDEVQPTDVTDGPGPAADDHQFADADVEIVLYAERVTVVKQVVPVERVRLRTNVVTDDVLVTEELAREEVDVITEPRAELSTEASTEASTEPR